HSPPCDPCDDRPRMRPSPQVLADPTWPNGPWPTLEHEGTHMTTAIRGEILTYLEAIGADDGSDAMIAAMEAVGTTFSIKEYTSTGVHEKYLIFAKGGVDFLLHDGIVDTVFFHLRDSEKYAAYAHPDALVE